MNLSELIAAFRLRSADTVKPYLWSDEEVTLYVNEAESEAAQRALLIQDETIELSVDSSGGMYDLPASVLKVRRAKLSDGTLLEITSREAMDIAWTGWETSTGTPQYIIDNDDGTATVIPIPVVADTITLAVYRLPTKAMASDSDEPEIHAKHHYRMLDWALRCAYLKQDADAFDKSASDRYEAAFDRSFGYRHTANVQRKHRDKRSPSIKSGW